MHVNLVAAGPPATPHRLSPAPVAGTAPAIAADGGEGQLQTIWPGDAAPLESGIASLVLDLHTSQNEEHTSPWIVGAAKQSLDLGERVHHYAVLLLARRRLDDARRCLEPDSCGWIGIEQLATMLGIDGAYLNILIHRCARNLSLRWDAITRGRIRCSGAAAKSGLACAGSGSCAARRPRGNSHPDDFVETFCNAL